MIIAIWTFALLVKTYMQPGQPETNLVNASMKAAFFLSFEGSSETGNKIP